MGLRDKIKPNLGAGMPPMISRQGNRFTLRDASGNDSKPMHELDIVIVDGNANVSKMWREDKNFDPNNPLPPDCFSDNGVAPSMMAQKPQSDRCITCRWNERDSAVSKVSGKGVKACSDNQKLAVIVPDDPQRTLYQFVVTPGNLKAFRQYVNQLEGHRYEVEEVVTRISFAPKEMGVLLFEAVGTAADIAGLTNDDIAALTAGGAARFVTGEDDQPRQAALPKPEEPRHISTRPEQREEAPQEETKSGPTREQLEAQLAKMRETGPRGRKGPGPAEPAPEEIPAFLNRGKGTPTKQSLGMVADPPAPSAEVTKLVQKHVNGNGQDNPALAERVTKAFGLPLRP
jgi:hypothetical protein